MEPSTMRLMRRNTLRFALTLAVCAVFACLPRVAVAQDDADTYDVLPKTWITADGRLPAVASPPSAPRNGHAVGFPSLREGDPVQPVPTFETDDFFGHRNGFPQQATFQWPSRNHASISIAIRRVSSAPQRGAFDIDPASMRSLRVLRW